MRSWGFRASLCFRVSSMQHGMITSARAAFPSEALPETRQSWRLETEPPRPLAEGVDPLDPMWSYITKELSSCTWTM